MATSDAIGQQAGPARQAPPGSVAVDQQHGIAAEHDG